MFLFSHNFKGIYSCCYYKRNWLEVKSKLATMKSSLTCLPIHSLPSSWYLLCLCVEPLYGPHCFENKSEHRSAWQKACTHFISHASRDHACSSFNVMFLLNSGLFLPSLPPYSSCLVSLLSSKKPSLTPQGWAAGPDTVSYTHSVLTPGHCLSPPVIKLLVPVQWTVVNILITDE